MPRYEDYECPVCKAKFEDGDDIVTCPDCGTPHHRECYNLIGKCVNHSLHKTGYTFGKSEKKEEKKSEAKQGEYYNPDASDANQPSNVHPLFGAAGPSFDTQFDHSNEKIDDVDISDIAATVRINTPRFITKFRKIKSTNKKIGWNWGAFFFGSLYYLFRRMYKQGISLYCLAIAIVFGANALELRLAPKYFETMSNIMLEYSEKINNSIFADPNMVLDMYNKIVQSVDASTISTLAYVTYGVIALFVVIRILEAMFADYCYMKTTTDIVKKVNDQLDNDAAFTQMPMMANSQAPLSQDQMKKMYLARKGGVSLFAPMLALMCLSILRMLLG